MGKKRLIENKNGNLIPIFILLPSIMPISFLVLFQFLFLFIILGKRSGLIAKCHTSKKFWKVHFDSISLKTLFEILITF